MKMTPSVRLLQRVDRSDQAIAGVTPTGVGYPYKVSMAREFDVRVIAEGVETAEQLELLSEPGCDLAQGDFLSKPLDTKGMTQLLR